MARIYATTNPAGSNTSVPVATYPVIKREQVPLGGGGIEWYEIRVDGKLAWIDDEPGQLNGDSCGPV